MTIRTDGRRTTRVVLLTLAVALVVVLAGCAGVGVGPGGDGNETTREDVTEPPQVTDEPTEAPTDEPTEVPTDEPTDEPTEAPPETETPGGGDGGDGAPSDGESDPQTLLLLGALAVFAVGFVAAGILRSRPKSSPQESTPVSSTAPSAESQSDSERVVSLLHRNNGRMFEDILEEELDWSPAHARRVVDGLVATGDVERRETDSGTLVVFSDPDRAVDEE